MSQIGYPVHLVKLLWRPIAGSLAMGGVLYVFQTKSLMLLTPVALVATVVYFAVVLMLGAFTSEELGLVKEGLGFARAFVQERSHAEMQRKPL